MKCRCGEIDGKCPYHTICAECCTMFEDLNNKGIHTLRDFVEELKKGTVLHYPHVTLRNLRKQKNPPGINAAEVEQAWWEGLAKRL